MLVNQTNLDALFTGYKVVFDQAFQNAPVTYDQVATEVPSTGARETYPWLGKNTKFRKWVGDRAVQGLMTHGFTIENVHYEDTVAVNRDNIEDDSYGIFSPMIGQLGQDSKVHPDQLVWSLCKAGISSVCYDGQYFFDTDHPGYAADGSATTVVNVDSGGAGAYWYVFDTTKIVKPFIFQKRKDYQFVPLTAADSPNVFNRNEFIYGVDARVNVGYGLWQLGYASNQALDATHFSAAVAAMQSIRMESGDVMGVMPNTLVVPPTLAFSARQLLNASIISNTSNVLQGAANLIVSPRVA